MPLNYPQKSKIKFSLKNKIFRLRDYFRYFLMPEFFLIFIVLISVILAFVRLESWFFIFASVFSLGYFGERIVKQYGKGRGKKQRRNKKSKRRF
jgi:hypothetical protein